MTATPIDPFFLNADFIGLIGPMVVIIIGYFVSKKNSFLGLFYFIFESMIAYYYLQLIDATPFYWWQIMFLLLGGVLTCIFPQASRR